MISREKQLAEAIKRMKKLKLHPNTISDLKGGTVNVSEQIGILYWANEEEQEIIANFEEKFNALVYHAILTPTQFGLCLSLLYVSQHEDEWEYDNMDIEDLTPYAMVINLDCESYSDMGCIGVRPMIGGLVRTS